MARRIKQQRLRARTILSALITAVRRDLKSVGSFSGNNLFVAGMASLFLGDPGAFVALSSFIGLVLFIPLSADPLRVLPPDRVDVWPLGTGELRWLRILSPWLNPVMWIVAALAVWQRVSMGVFVLAAAVFAMGFLLPSLPAARKGMWRRMPTFSRPVESSDPQESARDAFDSRFLVQRGSKCFLSGLSLRGDPAAEALLPMTILVMLAISTYSQTLFGLDGDGGMTRYRLLPVPGWQILAAKDVPFLLVSVLMTMPLAPARRPRRRAHRSRHWPSRISDRHSHQMRWRFSSGVSFGASIIQVVVMSATAAAVHTIPLLVFLCAGVYAWSTWWYGRIMEQLPL